MEKIIGDKKSFALGIDILKYEPQIWGRSCLWVNGNQIGDFGDENILAPFIRSVMRIAIRYEKLWDNELDGLECKELFYKVFPFYNKPDEFDDLTHEEQRHYIKYDTFIFELGENFDSWILTSVVKNDNCKFIWVHARNRDSDIRERKNDIKCFDVPLKDVQEAYRQLCELIPDQYWPTSIEKLQ